MKRFLILALLTVAPLAAQTAHADEPAAGDTVERGVSLGLRTGFAFPMGSSAQDVNLSDSVSGQIPIWLDAGYLINPHIYVGAYFQYGIVLTKNCPPGVSCSGNDLRFGANLHYHILPDRVFDPWVGGGIGYEIGNSSASAGGQSVSGSVSGFEFLNVQAGGDYKVTPAFGIGPFIGMTFGQYANESINGTSGSIQNTALHEWFYLGVRGVYDIAM
jgi:hypothetical protein